MVNHRLDLLGIDLLGAVGAAAVSVARAMQVWIRPPEPDASPLPTVVTRTVRSPPTAWQPRNRSITPRPSIRERSRFAVPV